MKEMLVRTRADDVGKVMGMIWRRWSPATKVTGLVSCYLSGMPSQCCARGLRLSQFMVSSVGSGVAHALGLSAFGAKLQCRASFAPHAGLKWLERMVRPFARPDCDRR